MNEARESVPPTRRRWSWEERRGILRETMEPNASIIGVARRHGVSAVSIYAWRKDIAAEAAGVLKSSAEGHKTRARRHPLGPGDGPGVADGTVARLSPRIAALEARLRELETSLGRAETARRSLSEFLRTLAPQFSLLARILTPVPPPQP